ncbi:MAG: DUF4143 domain-containing protein, partial [Spirosomaceae bacterium]|nr:DUF4143 domain-containing protein [Spirosomataceae bacterium]
LPLTPSGKQFKLFHLDIGLLLRKSKLTFKDSFVQKSLTAAFNGMLAEQFVAQQLYATSPDELCYWARTTSGSASEVDFVITKEGEILPIEVEAGKGGSMKSLHYLLNHNSHIKKAVVFSKSKFGVDDKIHFLPLYYFSFLTLSYIKLVF